MHEPYDWARLNHLQIGRYAEYYVKMAVTLHAYEVYTAEVDDHGIDFIMRRGRSSFLEVQVKSVRDLGYIFLTKLKCELRDTLLVAVVLFRQHVPPDLFLIPSTSWRHPNALLASRDYVGKQSPPEWGINLSAKNLPLLEPYRLDTVMAGLPSA